jgi:hypothetical protein
MAKASQKRAMIWPAWRRARECLSPLPLDHGNGYGIIMDTADEYGKETDQAYAETERS